jgi:hypothetical protein
MQPDNREKLAPTSITVGWITAVIFLLLWLTLLVAGYFWAHKPFDFSLFSGLLLTGLSVSLWLLLLALATATGLRLAGTQLLANSLANSLANEPLPVQVALAAGLGLGLLSLLLLLWGLLGGLHSVLAWAGLLLVTAWLRHDLRRLLVRLRAYRWPRPQGRFELGLALYILLALLFTFCLALAPELGWDAHVYHLTGPKLFLEMGRIGHPIDLFYLGFPQLGGMQFMLGLLLVGDGLTALFHFGYGLLALVLVMALSAQAFGRETALPSGALLLSVTAVLELMMSAYVDITLLFYTTAAFYAFWRWRDSRQTGWLLLLGLFCGFCAGVKYTAVAVPIALGLSLLWVLRRRPLVDIIRQGGLLTLVTTLTTVPWLLKNWLVTGNPVYPFLFDDALYWNAWRGAWYDRSGTGLLYEEPLRLLVAPLEATILGTTGSTAYAATIGPFILGLLFLLPLVWRYLSTAEKGIMGHLLFFFGLNYGLWLWGLARSLLLVQTRLLLPMFGITAVIAAVILLRLDRLTRPALAVGWLTRVIVSLTLALILFSWLQYMLLLNPLPVALGLESKSHFWQRTLGPYQTAIETINSLPADTRVQFLWEPRSYGCQVDCRPDALLEHFWQMTQHQGFDETAVAAAWAEQGVTHLLLSQRGLDFLLEDGFDPIREDDLAILQAVQEQYLIPIAQWENAYILYEFDRNQNLEE